MSNPAVIILTSKNLKNNNNFRIEDNIGECIHMHYANMRFDFSIKEFVDLENIIQNSILNILKIDKSVFSKIDIEFLADISEKLSDLESITVEKINLDKLIVNNYTKNIPYYTGLNNSMMYRALNGDNIDYINYNQKNWIEESNMDRLRRVDDYFSANSNKIQPIILFNRQNIIRDGQHRASIYLKKNLKEINVLRLHFKDEKYNMPKFPIINYLIRWDIKRIKRIYKKIRSNLKIKKKLFRNRFNLFLHKKCMKYRIKNR